MAVMTTGLFPDNGAKVRVGVQADPQDHDESRLEANRLARQLNLPGIANNTSGVSTFDYALTVTPQRLELRRLGVSRDRPVAVELLQKDTYSRGGSDPRQLIARAVGCRSYRGNDPIWIVDATAGFGGDTWLLASLGCRVTAIERSPIIAALLRNGLDRAREVAPTIADRVFLFNGDARDWLAALGSADDLPDVVYLDPMFPPKRKAALPRKAIQVLQTLVGPDNDAQLLLDVARRSARWRVVLKRPLHSVALSTGKPTASHQGKSVRYDVYQIPTPDEPIRRAESTSP